MKNHINSCTYLKNIEFCSIFCLLTTFYNWKNCHGHTYVHELHIGLGSCCLIQYLYCNRNLYCFPLWHPDTLCVTQAVSKSKMYALNLIKNKLMHTQNASEWNDIFSIIKQNIQMVNTNKIRCLRLSFSLLSLCCTALILISKVGHFQIFPYAMYLQLWKRSIKYI